MIKKMMCSAVMAATLLTPLTAMAERWVHVGSGPGSEGYYDTENVEKYKALRGVWTKNVPNNGDPPSLIKISISCHRWSVVGTHYVEFNSVGQVIQSIAEKLPQQPIESGGMFDVIAKQVCYDYERPLTYDRIPRP